VAANALVEGGLSRETLLRWPYEMEGHADNAAAALYGGLTLVSAGRGGRWPTPLMARAVPVPAMRG
jgi:homoserine kinase